MKGTSKRLILALKVLVATLLTFLLIKYASLQKIGNALQSADRLLLLAGMTLIPVHMWLNARQLKFLTDCHSMKVSLPRIVGINASTEFYNLFLPGIIAGGAIRWLRLSQGNEMRAEALTALIANRILNLYLLLFLGLVCWLIEADFSTNAIAFYFMSACLLVLTVFSALLSNARLSNSVQARIDNSIRIKPIVRDVFLKLIAALNEYRRISRLERMFLLLYAIGWHFAVVLSTYLFARALQIEVQLTTLIWIRSVLSVFLMFPITISGFGIREGGWILLLTPYGVEAASAFALSLLTFARQVFQAVIGGMLEVYAVMKYETE